MRNWGRRIRGAIGMGLAWGAAAFGAGILLARVPPFNPDLPFALMFAPLGFVSGVIFSGILVAVEGRRGFDRMSLSRFAVWGAGSGLLLSGIFAVGAALRGASMWGEFLVFGPALATASALCAAGSLALARRAERRELAGPIGDPTEAELIEDEKRERPLSRSEGTLFVNRCAEGIEAVRNPRPLITSLKSNSPPSPVSLRAWDPESAHTVAAHRPPRSTARIRSPAIRSAWHMRNGLVLGRRRFVSRCRQTPTEIWASQLP